MAKKQRGAVPEPTATSTVSSKDVLQRLSFLYQASVLLANVLPPTQSAASSRTSKRARKGKGKVVEQARLIPTQPGQLPAAVDVEMANDGAEGEANEGEPAAGSSSAVKEPIASSSAPNSKPPVKKPTAASVGAARPVSRSLIRTMREVAKKGTVRMDPTVKRTMCKGCSAVLVPGVTSTVRIKPSGPHAHLIIHTCLACRTRRRLPAPPHRAEELPLGAEPEVLPAAASPDDQMEVDIKSEAEPQPARKQTKRERREARQARRPVFFERAGHVTFAGDEQVVRE